MVWDRSAFYDLKGHACVCGVSVCVRVCACVRVCYLLDFFLPVILGQFIERTGKLLILCSLYNAVHIHFACKNTNFTVMTSRGRQI